MVACVDVTGGFTVFGTGAVVGGRGGDFDTAFFAATAVVDLWAAETAVVVAPGLGGDLDGAVVGRLVTRLA
jgi:hypothetical protein